MPKCATLKGGATKATAVGVATLTPQAGNVESQRLQNGQGDLPALNRAGDGLGRHRRIGDQEHDVRIVIREAVVYGKRAPQKQRSALLR
jgi:hypothetical protein